jgi:hypothetical protein
MCDPAIRWEGKHSPYDRPEDWVSEFERRNLSSWMLGAKILASHNERRFLTRAAEDTVVAGSGIRLRISGITPLAPLAILHGRLNEEPLDLFGKVVVPYEERLDALINLPSESNPGTYVFLAQQWEPGRSAYPGASLIYASSAASVEVRPHIDDEEFWNSFEPWPEDLAEEVRENIRQARKGL